MLASLDCFNICICLASLDILKVECMNQRSTSLLSNQSKNGK